MTKIETIYIKINFVKKKTQEKDSQCLSRLTSTARRDERSKLLDLLRAGEKRA